MQYSTHFIHIYFIGLALALCILSSYYFIYMFARLINLTFDEFTFTKRTDKDDENKDPCEVMACKNN